MQSKQNIVTIGSSSEISQCFYKQATSKDFLVHTISRIDLKTSNHLKINDYINEVEKIKLFLSNIENPIIIFFNGFLAENRDLTEPTVEEINKTDYVNYQIPYFLSKSLSENKDIKKFIFISSIASVRPRYKNYIYGLSKYKLEKSLRFLNLSKYLVLRFGKVETKMSSDHKSPPFTISANKAANIILKKLDFEGFKYASFSIFISGLLVLIFPKRVIDNF